MSAPSVLEYARSHGLADDHTAENLFKRLPNFPLNPIENDTENDTELPDPDFSPFAHELTEPKLRLSHRAAGLLAESIRRPQHILNWASFLPEPHRVRKLKIEEPVLAGDHETDVLRFRRDASSHLDGEQLLEACSLISSSPGQDFEDGWNDVQSGNAVKRLEKDLQDERCHTTKASLIHLSDILKDKLTDKSKEKIINSFLPPIQKPRARSLTPTLMPEEQSPEPYIPSSPDLDFPFCSEQDVDFDNLLLQIDREMREKDRIGSDEAIGVSPTKVKHALQQARAIPKVKLGEDLRVEDVFPSCTVRRQARKGLENLKFDVPILSSSSFLEQTSDDMTMHCRTDPTRSSPSKPEYAFHINSFARSPFNRTNSGPRPSHPSLSHVFGEPPSSFLDEFPLPNTIDPGDDDFGGASDVEVSEELLRLTDTARHEIDAMIEEDTIGTPEGCLKHPVPRLDTAFISPPWASEQDDFLASSFDEICLIPTTEVDLQKEKKLNWQAIPDTFMKLVLIDKIEDDGKLHKRLEVPQAVTKSEQLIFKKPVLRLLAMEDDTDEEIEEDVDLLFEMRELVKPTVPAKRLESGLDWRFNFPAKKQCVSLADGIQGIHRPKDSLTAPFGNFSTSSALETFLDLRGGRFKRVVLQQRPSAQELVDDPIQHTQPKDSNDFTEWGILGPQPLYAQPESTATTVQVPSTPNQDVCHGNEEDEPKLAQLEWGRTVLVETSILQRHRPLINFLEMYGNDRLNIVYREMSKIGRDNCASAAPDMILNPRTALIFTSLQALIQKSLPGQGAAGQSLVQNRMLKLVQDYAQLFVLVTAPTSNSTSVQAQVDTISAFTGFCACLSSNDDMAVIPIWVTSQADPLAIDKALNRWTWNLIFQHAFPEIEPAQSIQQVIDTVALINDETLWEQFLRRAGLNPMAAQILLGSLKRPDSPVGSFDQNWGLRRLVQMHPDERRGMFADTLGLRVMARLNDVLDRNWG